jgi:hypothetical protein
MAPRPASLCGIAHPYDSLAFCVMSVRPATYRRTSQPTVRRSIGCVGDAPDRIALRADRCEAKLPSCPGRRIPVVVSMPSTRTTHLSRCLRTVGWPVAFQDAVR